MKKALAILLVLILAISISACNVIIPTDTKSTTSTIASTTSSTNQNKPSDSPNDSFDVSEGLVFVRNKDRQSYSIGSIGTCTDLYIVIPDTYNGLPVTSIGGHAFKSCTSLVSIVFKGTTEQWNEIEFGEEWYYNISAIEVICSNGTVTIQ